MMPELGLFCLILALMFALLLGIMPALGVWKDNLAWQKTARPFVMAQCVFVGLSYLSLTVCFLQDDFSVLYVLTNSSVQLPWFYKLCAVWGGHEGSMLLWVSILSLWMLAVAFWSKSLPEAMRARVLAILGWLSVGLLLFILSTSNPFTRQFQTLSAEGRDLNPLLQDPGFLFHPPMLYMGYVGFSVAFAFAIAGLWAGQIESAWAKWTRPWTLAAWCCLTAGITLGSWWAYRELGWGGWWFWDPVENASFMPWLVGTALLHSLAVSEQRRQFQAWTLLLAISAFSLSLIGTFLVRSGVLTSVHAFAVDPERGLYILWFLCTVVGGSMLLFALRGHTLKAHDTPTPLSRESALLLNNVILVVIMLTVLMGTVYPLLMDGLGLGKLSVGAPYFNTVFIPLIMPLLFLMGLGVHLRWQRDSFKRLFLTLRGLFFISLVFPFIVLALLQLPVHVPTALALAFACWISSTTLCALVLRLKTRTISDISRSYWGMMLAHLGVAVSVTGIAVSSGYGLEKDVKLGPDESTMLGVYQVTFEEENALKGPNYHGSQVRFRVSHGRKKALIFPEKRIYEVGQIPMTESAIDVTPFRDIYIALGEPLDDTAWSVRLYYKPLVRWIWGGGFLILIGGLMALSDKRYYVTRQRQTVLLEEEKSC